MDKKITTEQNINVQNTGAPAPIIECPKCKNMSFVQVVGKSSISGTQSTIFECVSCGHRKVIQPDHCFVATAVYVNADHPNLTELRCFRDEFLTRYAFGRLFIRTYYFIGPIMAKSVRFHPLVTKLTKKLLDRLVVKISSHNKARQNRPSGWTR